MWRRLGWEGKAGVTIIGLLLVFVLCGAGANWCDDRACSAVASCKTRTQVLAVLPLYRESGVFRVDSVLDDPAIADVYEYTLKVLPTNLGRRIQIGYDKGGAVVAVRVLSANG